MHTHLVESLWEAQEALNLFPGYSSDAEIYERAGLMDHGPSIFAHVIFPTEEDKRILKKTWKLFCSLPGCHCEYYCRNYAAAAYGG